MEKQRLLPIRITRDDNEEKPAMVIQVKDRLNQLLDSAAIVNLEPQQSSELLSIYKIPFFMRETHPKAFEPQLVSFGPYHHEKEHLLPMELEKVKLFHSFKTRRGLDVESIVMDVSSILEDLLASYDKLEDKWTQDPGKFLQLMVVDGCFMLALFCSCDPGFIDNIYMDIKQDVLLLENQLPMRLLEMLYSMGGNPRQSQNLQLKVCAWLSISPDPQMKECLHILDMYKMSLLLPAIDMKDSSVERDVSDPECQVIRPATKLRDAGIKFEKSKSTSLTDVEFDPKQGVLRLPRLIVDDDTKSTFLNVMAFEKLHVGAGRKVTSFVIFMHNLIHDQSDVALLASDKILVNALGSESEAAELFSQLGNGVAMGLDSHMLDVHKKVNTHCNKPWNERCATLKHIYFQSPWTIISLCAAIFGFIILILQGIYQLLDYYGKA